MKTKNSSNKMLPPLPMRTEARNSDSKSNTLLSELTWHLLVRLKLLTKLSKSKNQVAHEQVSPERRGPGLSTHWG